MASKEDIIESYEESLKGEKFKAKFIESKYMADTGSTRYVFQVDGRSRAVTTKLKQIWGKYNTKIWKGFTCPEDGPNCKHYHLYLREDWDKNKSYTEFQFEDFEVFKVDNKRKYSDGYGVNIILTTC